MAASLPSGRGAAPWHRGADDGANLRRRHGLGHARAGHVVDPLFLHRTVEIVRIAHRREVYR